jgi:hypothetical protein
LYAVAQVMQEALELVLFVSLRLVVSGPLN